MLPSRYTNVVKRLERKDFPGFPKIIIPKGIYDYIVSKFSEYNRRNLEYELILYGVYVKKDGNYVGVVFGVIEPEEIVYSTNTKVVAKYSTNFREIYKRILKTMDNILEEESLPLFDKDVLRVLVIHCHNHPSGNPSLSGADRRGAYALRYCCGGIAILGLYIEENGKDRLLIYAKPNTKKWPPFRIVKPIILDKSPEEITTEYLQIKKQKKKDIGYYFRKILEICGRRDLNPGRH